jgi:pre-mRNA-splicing factor 18
MGEKEEGKTLLRISSSFLTAIMDFLRAEVEKKRKALDSEPASGQQKKYIRRADLEREREAAYVAEQEARKAARARSLLEGAKRVAAAEHAQGKSLPRPDQKDGAGGGGAGAGDSPSKPEVFKISNEEAVRRLRAKGQPIRLFGESDKDRRLRLRALELIEERTEGQRNDFMAALETMDKGLDLEELSRKANPISKLKAAEGTASAGGVSSREGSTPASGPGEGDELDDGTPGKEDEQQIVDLSLLKTNPSKLYPQIYFGIKASTDKLFFSPMYINIAFEQRVLKEWEQSMAERPGKFHMMLAPSSSSESQR